MTARMSPLREWYLDLRTRLGQRSYAQEGEDLVLLRYFGEKRDGFFVDVGAHHPFRFSNTYLLYRRGWRGVNIDAMPGSMEKFRRWRPRDVNIESAIGSAAGTATYFMFNEPALNTFDPSLVAERNVAPWKLVSQVSLPVSPLGEILQRAVPQGQGVDLMTIDVEGRDLDVLRSNDWERFRPRMVLAETKGRSISDLQVDATAAYLDSLGYIAVAKTYNTTFMIDKSSGDLSFT